MVVKGADSHGWNKNIKSPCRRRFEASGRNDFADLGIPTSTAINMFLRTVVRYGGIPFDLRISPNELETLRAIDDVNHHRNLSKTYDSVKDAMEALNA